VIIDSTIPHRGPEALRGQRARGGTTVVLKRGRKGGRGQACRPAGKMTYRKLSPLRAFASSYSR
jgi:hypothetical protein